MTQAATIRAPAPEAGGFVNFRPPTTQTEKDLAAAISTAARDIAGLTQLRATPAVYDRAVSAVLRLETLATALRAELGV